MAVPVSHACIGWQAACLWPLAVWPCILSEVKPVTLATYMAGPCCWVIYPGLHLFVDLRFGDNSIGNDTLNNWRNQIFGEEILGHIFMTEANR